MKLEVTAKIAQGKINIILAACHKKSHLQWFWSPTNKLTYLFNDHMIFQSFIIRQNWHCKWEQATQSEETQNDFTAFQDFNTSVQIAHL